MFLVYVLSEALFPPSVYITGYPGTTLKENEVFFKKVGI
ncbi:hypothetical protein M083_4049 [Bacteroides fragilis str. 3986 T(B)9]|jgi:hypothetical protein|uniref:Uncharacterized protein n=2 Tax=Bacteroides fragilis TaxID=817 RepID=A0A016AII4_BACFG|nr:hypothetical protein M101_4168 [Bacteroides fragilis str. 1007-1-F \